MYELGGLGGHSKPPNRCLRQTSGLLWNRSKSGVLKLIYILSYRALTAKIIITKMKDQRCEFCFIIGGYIGGFIIGGYIGGFRLASKFLVSKATCSRIWC